MNLVHGLAVAVATTLLALPVANAASDGSATPSGDSAFKVNKEKEKKARFAEREAAFQQQSRSSASGSPRVDKSVSAADAAPKATTKAARKQQFANKEKELQRQSSP